MIQSSIFMSSENTRLMKENETERWGQVTQLAYPGLTERDDSQPDVEQILTS